MQDIWNFFYSQMNNIIATKGEINVHIHDGEGENGIASTAIGFFMQPVKILDGDEGIHIIGAKGECDYLDIYEITNIEFDPLIEAFCIFTKELMVYISF